MSDPYLCNKLAKIEEAIDAYLDAIAELSAGNVKTYDLDTGQTQQRVTKYDIDKLQAALNNMLNLRAVIRVRCGIEPGQMEGRPGC